MKNELITVIVPVYKIEPYIQKCVDSILRQTYSNLEIILVDDGSPDGCPEICDEYAKTDSRVRVIHKENGGLSSARNAGLDTALGQYIAFVDGDDYIHPKMMENLYAALKETEADISVCNLQYVDENGNAIPEYSNDVIQNQILNSDEVFQKSVEAYGYYYSVVWNKLYKRKVWESYRFREGKVHEDNFAFHHIIGQCSKISCIRAVLYYYVQRTGSIMSEKIADKRMDAIEAIFERIDFFREKNKLEFLPSLDKSCFFLLCDIRKLCKTKQDKSRFQKLERKYNSVHKWILNNTRYLEIIKLKRIGYRYFPIFVKSFLKMKERLKKIFRIYKKKKFLYSFHFRRFKQDGSRQRVILIDTPIHGNLGDQAIVLAEQKFISEMLEYDCYEFTQAEYIIGKNELTEAVHKEDILLIHGGGFIGTLWQNEEDTLISILQDFSENRIVIFPQTVFFEESWNGILEKKRLKGAVKECENIKIFLRDRTSYRIMTEEMSLSEQQCFLVPDIVTYLNAEAGKHQRNKILFCMREDKEKTSDENQLLSIFYSLAETGEDVAFTDTMVNKKIGKKKRQKAVEDKLLEFSSAKLVITDRIHGMLFAAVTGTPCIAMDNISRKVSGTYKWIQYLDYVRFVDEEGLTLDLVWEMLDKKECNYSNIELQEYYDIMKQEILS